MTTGAGATYSIAGESGHSGRYPRRRWSAGLVMGRDTEASTVKHVLTDRVLTDETRLALLVRIL